MKFTCQQKDFFHALSTAQKAVGGNTTLPILENVLITAENNKVSIIATNLEIGIQTSCDANVVNEGKTTLPAKTLVQWIALANDDEVQVEKSEGESLAIACGKAKTTIKGMAADDFPGLPQVEKQDTAQVKQKELKNALDKVVFAAATAGTRPVLSGILFQRDGDNLVLVGTDSYRLSEKKVAFSAAPNTEINCVVPAKTLNELSRILGDEGDVEITFSQNQIVFRMGTTEISSRLIDGQFPNYAQILPTGFSNEVTVDKKQLIQTIKRVGIFAKENNNNMKFFFEGEQLRITTDATEIGNEESTLDVKAGGQDVAVSLNSQYFLDILLSVKSDQVILKLGEKLAPVLIVDEKEKDFLHIIMPLKM